jgi:urease accessory protein
VSSATGRSGRGSLLGLALGLVLVAPAQAHAPSSGLGPVVDGMAWLLETPTDLLLATALALQAPAQGAKRTWGHVLPFPLAWSAAALVAQALSPELLLAPLLSVCTLAVALLAALAIRLPPLWLLALQLSTGLGFGLVSGSLLAGHAGAVPVLLAAGLALLLWGVALRAVLPLLRGSWGAIAPRVGGSWIAAASLLMLGWQLRHPQ